jgi:hypothetical protein
MLGSEGIETGFAAMQLFRRAGLAFGARAGMAATEPPFECSDFLYAADRNKSHPDPKRSRVGERAAWAGAKAFGRRAQGEREGSGAGRDATPADFNDVLVEKARIAALPSPFARALASQKARGIDHGAPINVIKEGTAGMKSLALAAGTRRPHAHAAESEAARRERLRAEDVARQRALYGARADDVRCCARAASPSPPKARIASGSATRCSTVSRSRPRPIASAA